MAREKVIVKRLAAIENFGSMNVLCCDKTGTLTEGLVRVHTYQDFNGRENEKVLFYAYLNAFYETGFTNPIDAALRSHREWDLTGYHKLDEIPYDFLRKRLSVLVANDGLHLLITKGAVSNVLEICSAAETASGGVVALDAERETIQRRFEEFGSKGFRTLAIAYRDVGSEARITKDHEADMTFLGFLVFFDPEKPGIVEAIRDLKDLGISLKVISGDNHRVAAYISRQVGLSAAEVLTGSDLREIADEALPLRVRDVTFSQRWSLIRRNVLSSLLKSPESLSASWATASTMPRRFTLQTWEFPWTAPWTSRRKQRTLCCWKKT
jgi:Mg2+-importing ATPase